MTFRDAAKAVLRAAKRPMTTAEITEAAMRRGLLQTHGKTPQATMAAELYSLPTDYPIRREYAKGPSRAVRGSVRWVYVPLEE